MKKYFMTLAAVLCCTMMTTVFTACSSDDDDNNTPKKTEILGVGAHYTFSVTEQMSQLCDYTITYYGIGGKLETENKGQRECEERRTTRRCKGRQCLSRH